MTRLSVRRRFGLLFVALILAVSTASAKDTPPAESRRADPAGVGMDAKRLAEIPKRMREFVENKQVAGVVTLVARKGRIVHVAAVGLADVEEQRPMREDSLFAIASMTKPISATAVMILKDEGKLSLDDPVSKYIPAFKNASLKDGPPSRRITIRDCLTHTSGIVGSQRCERTLEETVDVLAKRPLGFQPGEKWAYSPGLNVCGRVVEIVSGQPFDRFLAERIFRPLKMTDTTFCPTPDQRKRLATVYEPGADKKSLAVVSHWISDDRCQRAPNPSGGLVSTATDMARFYQMVLNGGELEGRRIVSKASVEEMTGLQTKDLKTGFTPGNGWGLGWCIVRQPQGVTEMLSPGTFGHGGAFGTQGWVDPKREMIFVLMIQRRGFGNGDASDIRKTFQQNAVGAVKE